MICHIEDLRVGDWVTIATTTKRNTYPITGIPLKILAISLPFVAVTESGEPFAIDIRVCGLTKLSKKYVQAMGVQNARKSRKDTRIESGQSDRKSSNKG